MSSDKATEILAEALGLAPSQISENTSLETCPNWDSLAHFRVVAAVEELLDRPLSPSEIFDVVDFESIKALLVTKL